MQIHISELEKKTTTNLLLQQTSSEKDERLHWDWLQRTSMNRLVQTPRMKFNRAVSHYYLSRKNSKMNINRMIYEFHVSKQIREKYGFEDFFFRTNGRILIADFQAARKFAQLINNQRDIANFPEQAVRPGEINALGLIEEILHRMIDEYRLQVNPDIMLDALTWVDQNLGHQNLDQTLIKMVDEFPPPSVYRGEISAEEYLSGIQLDSDGRDVTNRQIVLEELILLWISNSNPAAQSYKEFFNDRSLIEHTLYSKIIDLLQVFFAQQPGFGQGGQNLLDLIQSPIREVPGSLTGQLEYIRSRWSPFISTSLITQVLSNLDLIREETRPYFPPGPGPAIVPEYFPGTISVGGDYPVEPEPEQFSPDLDWMPRLVMLAKNAYVWLDQLAKKYLKSIQKLDDIPDEELDDLARWGVTGLWLIGLWERSPASQKIKQLRGNPDAVASAYSLFSYEIANDLGGQVSFENLKLRAWKKGIRLASDMVPNHMGIDSRWVIEHPDWFISLDIQPFPSYTFNGLDLSWDERVGILIEDHYYDNTDAAVVFKRIDYWTGETKYIYHGNDGTSMPWNDTAQLNYLIPEVREAVIQTILHVARQTPIIRFDAAMTLAKKHFHRLWFPEPGSGGDIPSRAGLGLTRETFDEVFPLEFWREVVERVAQELPDTLLLAEAFWLMEGYFVRTLGMHRVYNSAFMNMLRDEKNQEYRLVIKNTLEFDPEILKRYVNFMSNPDERTAVDQFGKGDKYFGVCTMMATLPGLPMLGHGQIEGFTEKYGMEYRRAYWEETPDANLIGRHSVEIFPLLKKRALYSEVNNFLLFDFYTPEGKVDEDVFAYSNQRDDEKSIVIYHNRYKSTRGHIRISSAYLTNDGEEKKLVRKTLDQCLELPNDSEKYLIFRDHRSNLEYIRNCSEIHLAGLYLELDAYRCYVFHEFRIVQQSSEHPFDQLSKFLQGGGVSNIDEALLELIYAPILTPYKEILNSGFVSWLIQNRWSERGTPTGELNLTLNESKSKITALYRAVYQWQTIMPNLDDNLENPTPMLLPEPLEMIDSFVNQTINDLTALLALPAFDELHPSPRSTLYQRALNYLLEGISPENSLTLGSPVIWSVLISYVISANLGNIPMRNQKPVASSTLFEEWLLKNQVFRTMMNLGVDQWNSRQSTILAGLLLELQNWFQTDFPIRPQLRNLLGQVFSIYNSRKLLNVNLFNNHLWFRKESFNELVWFLYSIEALKASKKSSKDAMNHLLSAYKVIELLLSAEEETGYQVEKFIDWFKD